MLTIRDIQAYDITTPLEKSLAQINSKSTDAYTWISDANPIKPFTVISPYVYQGDQGVMLWAPTSGATTSSVHRTRTELKGKVFYLKDAEYHEAGVTIFVHKVNWYGSFVCFQCHCDDGNDPTNKTFVTLNKEGKWQLLNGLRTDNTTKDPKKELLLDNLDITKLISIKYKITQDGLFRVESCQGENSGFIEKQLSAERAARPMVIHTGAYNQVDEGNEKEPIDDGTLIEMTNLDEYHGDLPRTLKDIDNDVSSVLSSFKANDISKEDAQAKLQALQIEAEGFPNSHDKTAILLGISDALSSLEPAPNPTPQLDEYEALQAHLDAVEESYYTSLKLLQSTVKGELNQMTEDMKSLTDKQRLASIYTEIKQFKADMALALTNNTK